MMRRYALFIVGAIFIFGQAAAYGQTETGKDEAMTEAIFEAEYKQKLAEREEARQKDLKASMVGKRENAINKKYEVAQALEEAQKTEPAPAPEATPIEAAAMRAAGQPKKIPHGIDLEKGFVRGLNERIYPVKVSGEYQLSWGYDWGDKDSDGRRGMWKNADWNKSNLVYVLDNQYVFGADRENTYDKRIYDRFRLKMETLNETGLNYLSELVVDPWSFVGKTDYVMINGPGGQFPMQLRYWSNSQSTLDERIWLTNGTDFINVPEIKVDGGHTLQTYVTSRWATTDFTIPPMDINRWFRPLRKLELNFTSDNLRYKLFPLADQDHVYTSDDPMELSNHHIYWEPSPWLNRWKPALYFPPTGDFRRGKWANDISFESRDSDFTFLTLLRGLSFEMTYKDFYIAGMAATPMHPWQEYESINSIPGAFRIKKTLFDNYYIGGLYTFNYGLDQERIDAFNHVMGFDVGYEVPQFLKVRGEFARSIDRRDWHGNDFHVRKTKADANAFRVEATGDFLKKGKDPMLKVTTAFTHMGDNFRPRLANYKNTRLDQFWGKHINFQPVSPDFDAFRIGSGVDIGRDVYSIRIENALFGGILNSLSDARFVRRDYGGKVENVYRNELTLKPLANLSTKFLFRFQDLPDATAGRDSFIITDDISEDKTDEFLVNDDIRGNEDADVWTLSWGFHYDPVKWVGFEGIYERTNDYETFPQRVFNDASFRDLGDIRELNYFLYAQPLMAIPPYDDYDIWKARIYYTPFDTVHTKLEYVLNTFKHATGRDDNISHYGVEVDWDMTKKLTASFKFTRSQIIDLFMQQQRFKDTPFYHHNNIFAQLKYNINPNNTLIVQFGEFFAPTQYTPVPWLLNTIDTQRIVRFYLNGKF